MPVERCSELSRQFHEVERVWISIDCFSWKDRSLSWVCLADIDSRSPICYASGAIFSNNWPVHPSQSPSLYRSTQHCINNSQHNVRDIPESWRTDTHTYTSLFAQINQSWFFRHNEIIVNKLDRSAKSRLKEQASAAFASGMPPVSKRNTDWLARSPQGHSLDCDNLEVGFWVF